MTELVRKPTAAGHVQGYHVGSSVVGNPRARDAFYERPARHDAELPVEQCASFDGAAHAYRSGSLDWTWFRDLAHESGCSRDEAESAVKRHVHGTTLAEFGEPSAMPSFEHAVAVASAPALDEDGRAEFVGACKRVGRELLAGRKHPGPHFDAAIREAVLDAAE